MRWNSINSLFSAKLDYHWPADNVLVFSRVESPHSAFCLEYEVSASVCGHVCVLRACFCDLIRKEHQMVILKCSLCEKCHQSL